MNLFLIYGAALLMALLFASPALDNLNFKPFGDWRRRGGFAWREFFAEELGAVTVTYFGYNNNGTLIFNSTTAPTTAQAATIPKLACKVVFGVTADAQALLTHNWQLDASAPARYEPEVMGFLPQSTTTYHPLLTFDWTNTNVLAVNKPATDAPTTGVLILRRPISPAQ